MGHLIFWMAMHAYVGLVTVIQLHRMENNNFEKKEDNQTKGFFK